MARTIERAAFAFGAVPEVLKGTAFTEEAGADTFVISGIEGAPSGILAHVLRADNVAIAVDGTFSGGAATVTLDADCYHVAGRLGVAIYATYGDGESVCVYACVGNVYRTVSDVELDSGTEIPTLAQLEAAYNACVEATADAEAVVGDAPTDETGLALLTEEQNVTDSLERVFNGITGLEDRKNDQLTGILGELAEGNDALTRIRRGMEELDLSGDGVPYYFRDQLAAAADAYLANAMAAGADGESFVFVTDTHWGSNAKHSPALARWLVEHTSLRNVICGGDVMDSGTKAAETAKAQDFMQAFRWAPGGLKLVIGNHDFNKNGHGDAPSYWLSLAETYGLYYPQAGMEIHDVQCIEPDTGYYEISFRMDVPGTNTSFLFVSVPFGSVYPATSTWVEAQLTDHADRHFILVSHYLYNADSGSYPGGASGLITRVKAHSNVTCWLFGHIHNDLVLYTDTGLPLIATDTDSSLLSDRNVYTCTEGTVTEQCLDIVTANHETGLVECVRVGRGKSRTVHGGANAVSGTLTLTTEITGAAWTSSNTAAATVAGGVVTAVASGSAIIKAAGTDREEYWYVTVA